MLDYRMANITLLGTKTNMSEMGKITKIPRKKLLEEVSKLQKIMRDFHTTELMVDGEKVILPGQMRKCWLDLYFEEKESMIYYGEEERQTLIYLLSFSEVENLSVLYFQDFLGVSKNTILADIKRLRQNLEQSNISLEYSRKKGFYLDGTEWEIRSQAYQRIGKVLQMKQGERLLTKGLFIQDVSLYGKVREAFTTIRESHHFVVVPSRLNEMYYFLSYILIRTKHHQLKIETEEKKFLQQLSINAACEEFLAHFKELEDIQQEKLYFIIIFMTVIQGRADESELDFLLKCATDMIHQVESMAAIEFHQYKRLLFGLFYHLVPAYFRIKYLLPLHNIHIEKIKEQYQEIYTITSSALTSLEKITGQSIPEAEIGYFAILFGGEIVNQEKETSVKTYTGVVVCPNGISSSMIMKTELEQLFPLIELKEVYSVNQFHELEIINTDVIFSTVPLETTRKVYVIHPIMSYDEKLGLLSEVQNDLLVPGFLIPSVNDVLQMILPYVELKNGYTQEKLKQKIIEKFERKVKIKGDERPLLTELLTEDKINLTDHEVDWKEAIKMSAEPLLTSGSINESYVQAMIQKVEDYGAFIHIGQGLALPHARPEDGVNSLGMSLLKFDKPVLLLDDEKHAVQVFICLAAIDNEMHLRALASLTKVLTNKESLERLLNAQSKEEIIELFKEGEK